jgi:electron transfer flavoprotein alpha subunit
MFSVRRNSLLRQARSQLQVHARSQSASIHPNARFASTFVILEQKDGKMLQPSLQVVSAAKSLGGPVVGFIAGKSVKGAAEEAAKLDGLDKVIMVDNENYEKVCNNFRLRLTFLGSCRNICSFNSIQYQEG